MPIDARIPLQGIPFQPPKFDIGDTYVQLARIQALDAQRRGQDLHNRGQERTFAREDAWQAKMAQVFTPPQAPQGPPPGMTDAPQPPPTHGLTAPVMADQVPFASPPQGQYGLTAPPMPQGMPPSFARAPSTLQAPAMIPGAPGHGLTAPQGPPPPMGMGGLGAGAQAPPGAPPAGGLTAAPDAPARKPSPFAQMFQPLNMDALRQAHALDPEKTAQWQAKYVQMQGQKIEQAAHRTERMYTALKMMLGSDNPQRAYEVGVKQLREEGIPLPNDLPPVFDPAVAKYQMESLRTPAIELAEQKVKHEQQKIELEKMQTLVEARKAGQPQKVDYGYGPEMDAALDARFGDQIRRSGQAPTPAMVAQATQDVDARHVGRSVETFRQTAPERADIARQTGAAAQGEKPLEGPERIRMNAFTQAEDIAKQLATEFTPGERKRYVGMGGFRMTAQQLAQLTNDATSGKADPKFARFAALLALGKAEAFGEAGKALTETEKAVIFGYIPTGSEMSAEAFEQKLTLAQQRLPAILDRELKLSTAPRRELPGMRARGELSGQGRLNPPASTSRPVAEMSPDDIRAEIAALRGKR